MPLTFEVLPQGRVVLDGPVVDQRDSGAVVAVGVGVGFGDGTVRGPTGVGDSERAGESAALLELVLQHGDASDRTGDQKLIVEHCQASRVIPPVLETLEAFEEDGFGRPVSDISDDSAHAIILSSDRAAGAAIPYRRTPVRCTGYAEPGVPVRHRPDSTAGPNRLHPRCLNPHSAPAQSDAHRPSPERIPCSNG